MNLISSLKKGVFAPCVSLKLISRTYTTFNSSPLFQMRQAIRFSAKESTSNLTSSLDSSTIPSSMTTSITTTYNYPLLSFSPLISQQRFKARGTTFQPTNYKRKKKYGFLTRMHSKLGRKIVERRRRKGRWFLTY